jgi:hypothetical protein
MGRLLLGKMSRRSEESAKSLLGCVQSVPEPDVDHYSRIHTACGNFIGCHLRLASHHCLLHFNNVRYINATLLQQKSMQVHQMLSDDDLSMIN